MCCFSWNYEIKPFPGFSAVPAKLELERARLCDASFCFGLGTGSLDFGLFLSLRLPSPPVCFILS